MLPEKDRQKYDLAVVALKKRFRPVDIEELRGIEFHQLVQQEQLSVVKAWVTLF